MLLFTHTHTHYKASVLSLLADNVCCLFFSRAARSVQCIGALTKMALGGEGRGGGLVVIIHPGAPARKGK